jgi:biofilm PGA synthesis N-glycosyltransferase PgaC
VTELRPTYAVVTPVRNEADNLPRLARSLEAQTILPSRWLVVDNGSDDGTVAVAEGLAADLPWMTVVRVPDAGDAARGAPIVRSLHAGIERLEDDPPDFFVNLDADISFDPDYFERLLRRFADDPDLGIASGSGYEQDSGVWRQRHLTGDTVWGGSRMFRWSCLQDVLPFEERFAWDGIDQIKANSRGWRTKAFVDLPFRHHRREGERDGRFASRVAQGRAAHYLGYRGWYLGLRALRHMPREPAAVGLVWGYTRAALGGEPRCADERARAYLRRQQSPAQLPLRARETLAKRRRLSS